MSEFAPMFDDPRAVPFGGMDESRILPALTEVLDSLADLPKLRYAQGAIARRLEEFDHARFAYHGLWTTTREVYGDARQILDLGLDRAAGTDPDTRERVRRLREAVDALPGSAAVDPDFTTERATADSARHLGVDDEHVRRRLGEGLRFLANAAAAYQERRRALEAGWAALRRALDSAEAVVPGDTAGRGSLGGTNGRHGEIGEAARRGWARRGSERERRTPAARPAPEVLAALEIVDGELSLRGGDGLLAESREWLERLTGDRAPEAFAATGPPAGAAPRPVVDGAARPVVDRAAGQAVDGAAGPPARTAEAAPGRGGRPPLFPRSTGGPDTPFGGVDDRELAAFLTGLAGWHGIEPVVGETETARDFRESRDRYRFQLPAAQEAYERARRLVAEIDAVEVRSEPAGSGADRAGLREARHRLRQAMDDLPGHLALAPARTLGAAWEGQRGHRSAESMSLDLALYNLDAAATEYGLHGNRLGAAARELSALVREVRPAVEAAKAAAPASPVPALANPKLPRNPATTRSAPPPAPGRTHRPRTPPTPTAPHRDAGRPRGCGVRTRPTGRPPSPPPGTPPTRHAGPPALDAGGPFLREPDCRKGQPTENPLRKPKGARVQV
ncbi:hypothetical protein ACFPZ0_07900 [Streptomonospora nanhaiensis]|uniref:hypothetical protein n=1 Tax=Streptomonospora nanhaiensis TaxID=1323731 RepID=UPI001C99F3B1|nr:hypothetical protein [Streptomonospora nanhaiensis]MBX9387950.1 hypothetical protein [Streptomonospora nanhaiensis]